MSRSRNSRRGRKKFGRAYAEHLREKYCGCWLCKPGGHKKRTLDARVSHAEWSALVDIAGRIEDLDAVGVSSPTIPDARDVNARPNNR